MPDGAAELRALADRVRDRDGVADAWLAKSFTDRLPVVDVLTRGDHRSSVCE